jgi:hypothetical protein
MSKLVPPGKGVAETVVNGKTYRAKSGVYEVSNPKDAKAMKREGFFEASLNPFSKGDGARGFTCVECGFGSWFRKCSKCGHENEAPEGNGQ